MELEIPLVLACSGCSMLNLSVTLSDPEHFKWACLIVGALAAVPLLLKLLGFRLYKREAVSKSRKWFFSTIFFAAWLLLLIAGPYSSNFGIFLLHWFFLPLVIQYNIGLAFAMIFPPILPVSAIVIPAFYSYWLSKKLLLYEITRKAGTDI